MTDLTELLAARSDWVRALARSLIGDFHAADDVAQDALLAAASSGRADRGWLVGVVRNLVASQRRRAARHRRHEAARAERDAARAPAPSAAATAARVEQERLLTEAVLALDAPFREVVLLRVYDGLSPRAIAARLGVPVATVNSRWTRALAKLRRRLDEVHGGDGRAWLAALAPVAVAGGRQGTAVTVATSGGAWIGAIWMKKQVAWAGAALLLSLAGWWAVSSRPAGVEAPARPVTPAVARSADGPAVDAGTAAEPRPDADRSAVPTAPPATAAAALDTARVTVVDDLTGAPVPSAEVVEIRVDPTFQRRWELLRVRGDAALESDAVFGLGERVELDEDASFAAPIRPEGAMYLARHGPTHAMLRLDGRLPGGDRTLRLTRLDEVTVEVLDDSGRPAPGVPVALFTAGAGGRRQPYALARPGVDSHVTTLRWNPKSSWMPAGAISVGLYFAGAPAPIPVSDDRATRGRITLRCPPVGAVEAGPVAPVPDELSPIASLVPVDDQAANHGAGWETLLRDDRTARFWPVGLGLGRIRVRMPGAGRPVLLEGDGPTSTGETVTLGPPARLMLTARLVEGPDARPLAGAEYWIRVTPADWAGGQRGRADAQGWIRVPIGEPTPGLRRALTVSLADWSRREVRVDLPEDRLLELAAAAPGAAGAEAPPVVVDLGDLRFGVTLLLAAGTVVDPDGRPLADILVDGGVGDGDDARRLAWAPTDAEGRFRLLVDPGDDPGSERAPWVRASDPRGAFGHRRTTIDDRRDVLIRMTALGVLDGRLETGVPGTAPLFGVSAWRDDAPLDAPGLPAGRGAVEEIDRDGRFRLTGLPGVPHTVAVRTRNRNAPYWPGLLVRTVSGVPVVAGRATSPDALAPIDLRGLFDLVELDPRDGDGRRVAPHAFEAAGERRFVGVADGPLVVPKGVDTLVLVLDGHEPERVAVGEPPPGDGPRRVVMRSLRRVVLTVRSSFVLPPGQRLTVDLEPERLAGAAPATGTSPSMHAGARPYPGHQPDAAGRVEVPVARPGRYRVVVRVTTAAEIGAGYVPPIELPAEVCPVLEIGPVAAERPHEVVLPAVALRTASAALGGG